MERRNDTTDTTITIKTESGIQTLSEKEYPDWMRAQEWTADGCNLKDEDIVIVVETKRN